MAPISRSRSVEEKLSPLGPKTRSQKRGKEIKGSEYLRKQSKPGGNSARTDQKKKRKKKKAKKVHGEEASDVFASSSSEDDQIYIIHDEDSKKKYKIRYVDEFGIEDDIKDLKEASSKKEGQKTCRGEGPKPKPRTKNVNHCTVCDEPGEELISCIRCPASFHPICIEATMSTRKLPNEPWLCKRCLYEQNVLKKPRRVAKILPFDEDDRFITTIEETLKKVSEESITLEATLDLISGLSNPRGFNLPKELSDQLVDMPYMEHIPRKLPCDEKAICYVCREHPSLTQPAISCDYCPSKFHLHCLDSPMSEVLNEFWMCPLHPEVAVDRFVLNTTGISRRMHFWNKCRKKINTGHSWKDFLKKIRDEPFINASQHKSSGFVPPAVDYETAGMSTTAKNCTNPSSFTTEANDDSDSEMTAETFFALSPRYSDNYGLPIEDDAISKRLPYYERLEQTKFTEEHGFYPIDLMRANESYTGLDGAEVSTRGMLYAKPESLYYPQKVKRGNPNVEAMLEIQQKYPFLLTPNLSSNLKSSELPSAVNIPAAEVGSKNKNNARLNPDPPNEPTTESLKLDIMPLSALFDGQFCFPIRVCQHTRYSTKYYTDGEQLITVFRKAELRFQLEIPPDLLRQLTEAPVERFVQAMPLPEYKPAFKKRSSLPKIKAVRPKSRFKSKIRQRQTRSNITKVSRATYPLDVQHVCTVIRNISLQTFIERNATVPCQSLVFESKDCASQTDLMSLIQQEQLCPPIKKPSRRHFTSKSKKCANDAGVPKLVFVSLEKSHPDDEVQFEKFVANPKVRVKRRRTKSLPGRMPSSGSKERKTKERKKRTSKRSLSLNAPSATTKSGKDKLKSKDGTRRSKSCAKDSAPRDHSKATKTSAPLQGRPRKHRSSERHSRHSDDKKRHDRDKKHKDEHNRQKYSSRDEHSRRSKDHRRTLSHGDRRHDKNDDKHKRRPSTNPEPAPQKSNRHSFSIDKKSDSRSISTTNSGSKSKLSKETSWSNSHCLPSKSTNEGQKNKPVKPVKLIDPADFSKLSVSQLAAQMDCNSLLQSQLLDLVEVKQPMPDFVEINNDSYFVETPDFRRQKRRARQQATGMEKLRQAAELQKQIQAGLRDPLEVIEEPPKPKRRGGRRGPRIGYRRNKKPKAPPSVPQPPSLPMLLKNPIAKYKDVLPEKQPMHGFLKPKQPEFPKMSKKSTNAKVSKPVERFKKKQIEEKLLKEFKLLKKRMMTSPIKKAKFKAAKKPKNVDKSSTKTKRKKKKKRPNKSGTKPIKRSVKKPKKRINHTEHLRILRKHVVKMFQTLGSKTEVALTSVQEDESYAQKLQELRDEYANRTVVAVTENDNNSVKPTTIQSDLLGLPKDICVTNYRSTSGKTRTRLLKQKPTNTVETQTYPSWREDNLLQDKHQKEVDTLLERHKRRKTVATTKSTNKSKCGRRSKRFHSRRRQRIPLEPGLEYPAFRAPEIIDSYSPETQLRFYQPNKRTMMGSSHPKLISVQARKPKSVDKEYDESKLMPLECRKFGAYLYLFAPQPDGSRMVVTRLVFNKKVFAFQASPEVCKAADRPNCSFKAPGETQKINFLELRLKALYFELDHAKHTDGWQGNPGLVRAKVPEPSPSKSLEESETQQSRSSSEEPDSVNLAPLTGEYVLDQRFVVKSLPIMGTLYITQPLPSLATIPIHYPLSIYGKSTEATVNLSSLIPACNYLTSRHFVITYEKSSCQMYLQAMDGYLVVDGRLYGGYECVPRFPVQCECVHALRNAVPHGDRSSRVLLNENQRIRIGCLEFGTVLLELADIWRTIPETSLPIDDFPEFISTTENINESADLPPGELDSSNCSDDSTSDEEAVNDLSDKYLI